MKTRMSSKSAKPAKACLLEQKVSLPNLLSLPFSEFGSQSNTNSESAKSTFFRIITDQITDPKITDETQNLQIFSASNSVINDTFTNAALKAIW